MFKVSFLFIDWFKHVYHFAKSLFLKAFFIFSFLISFWVFCISSWKGRSVWLINLCWQCEYFHTFFLWTKYIIPNFFIFGLLWCFCSLFYDWLCSHIIYIIYVYKFELWTKYKNFFLFYLAHSKIVYYSCVMMFYFYL